MQKNMTLLAVSKPNTALRPSIVDWIGRDLAPIACGVLAQIFDDRPLQRAIADGEIAYLSSVTRSNFKTAEHPISGTYRSTTSFFFIEGTLFYDTVSVRAGESDPLGYWPVALDEIAGG
jgi:hypothetical protein